MTDFRFQINQIVKYKHGSGGQHWHGVVRARELYDDGALERAYYVRWINPNGQPESKLDRFPEEELEAA